MPNIIKFGQSLETGYLQLPLEEQAAGENKKESEEKPVAEKYSMEKDRAEQIIAEAEEEVQQILEQARAKAAELKQDARRDGLEEAEKQRDDMLKEAASVVALAYSLRKEMLEKVETEAIELSLQVAECLLKTTLDVEKDIIKNIVGEAISILAAEENIIVRVNSDDLAVCRACKEHFLEQLADGTSLKFIPTENVPRGSCIVQGEFTVIESFLQNRFQVLRDALIKETEDAVQCEN